MDDKSRVSTVAPDVADIRDALSRIVKNDSHGARRRLHDLLTYIVNEEIEGRGEQIKGATIAVDVFGRAPDSDARDVSTVRVEMHRLRQAIENFYANEGKAERVRFRLEPGSYRPQFSYASGFAQEPPGNDESAAALAPQQAPNGAEHVAEYSNQMELTPARPKPRWRLFVGLGMVAALAIGSAFVIARRLSGGCDFDRPTVAVEIERGNAGAWADSLAFLRTRFKSTLRGYSMVASDQSKVTNCGGAPKFILSLGESDLGGSTMIVATLRAADAPEVLWARGFKAPARGSDPDAFILIIARIAYAIAEGDGVIPTNAAAMTWRNANARTAYQCLISAHAMFASGDRELTPEIFNCLEKQIDDGTPFADVYGLYAAVNYYYVNKWFPGGPPDAAARYESAIEAGTRLNRTDREILINKLRTARYAKPVKGDEIQVLTRIVAAQFGDDPHLLNQAARTRGFGLGDWTGALELSHRALEIAEGNHLISATTYAAAIAIGDWPAAEKLLESNFITDSDYIAVLNLATAAHFGREDGVRGAVFALRKNGHVGEKAVEAYVTEYYRSTLLTNAILAEIRTLPPEIYMDADLLLDDPEPNPR